MRAHGGAWNMLNRLMAACTCAPLGSRRFGYGFLFCGSILRRFLFLAPFSRLSSAAALWRCSASCFHQSLLLALLSSSYLFSPAPHLQSFIVYDHISTACVRVVLMRYGSRSTGPSYPLPTHVSRSLVVRHTLPARAALSLSPRLQICTAFTHPPFFVFSNG